MESVLLSLREGPVATLIMNRPKARNALDPELLQALGASFAGGSGGRERARRGGCWRGGCVLLGR